MPATMDALVAAVEGAGATIFVRVDHAADAAKVEMDLAPSQVLIFGNPRLGTPAMLDNPLAGLFLPLTILVYGDGEGKAWLVYEDPGEMLYDLDGVSRRRGLYSGGDKRVGETDRCGGGAISREPRAPL